MTTSGSRTPRSVLAIGRWVTAADHVRIGLSLSVSAALWLLIAGVVGVILGVERANASNALVDAGALTQLFSLHRFALVFGVAAPLMLGLSLWMLPAQLHASNISLPRLAAFGWWAWLVGSFTVLVSYLANGGPGGGTKRYVELFLLALGVVLLGLIALAVVIATTVLTRRNGQRLGDIPVGAIAALIGALGIALTAPVALGTVLYLWVDYVNARVAFGGTDLMASWLGWILREPQTLLFVVPALGVLADAAVRTAKGRQPLRGVVLTGVGIAGTVIMSSVTQQAHVLVIGTTPFETLQSFVPFILFSAVPLLAPLVVVLLSLLAVKAGKPAISGAFVASLFGVGMIFTGLAGSAVMHVGSLTLVGTVFGEATVVYVVYGAVLAAFGAVTLHIGTATHRALPDVPVILLSLLGVSATVLASLPHYIAGFLDQPANVASGYKDAGFVGVANIVVALGHALMMFTVVLFVALVAKSRRGVSVADRYQTQVSA